MKLTRKEFLATTLAGAAGLFGEGCGSSDSGGSTAISSCGTTISENHPNPHKMTVTAADVKAGVDKTYDIQGAADHTHSVFIPASDFAKLAKAQEADFTSSPATTDGHTHPVTVKCS